MKTSEWRHVGCRIGNFAGEKQPEMVSALRHKLPGPRVTSPQSFSHLPIVGTAGAVGAICCAVRDTSVKRSIGRRSKIDLCLRSTGAWYSGQSMLEDPENAIQEVVAEWRKSLGSDLPLVHVSRPPSPFAGASGKPDWYPSDAATTPEPAATSQRTQQPENIAFGLLSVPHKWAADLKGIVVSIRERVGWPSPAPLIGILTSGDALSLGAAWQDCEQPAASAKYLDAETHVKLSQESMRFQNFILRYPLWSMQVYGGKVNGSMLACRHFFGRESIDVGSALIFGDNDFGMATTRRTMALLDISYPFAGKAGFVMDTSIEGNEQESCYLLGGEDGLDVAECGGCVVLLLPGSMGTAINFCGCEPIGDELEVFDADVRKGIIRTVGDGPRDVVPNNGERRPCIEAATALRRIVLEAGVAESDVWIGLPRSTTRDSAHLRVAPGAGEWALFPWGIVSAEGSLVLKVSPRIEGVCEKGIHRMQLFISKAASSDLGRLADAYKFKASMAMTEQVPIEDQVPYARLCFAGGPGPCESISDEHLYDSVAHGSAVLGCPGTCVPFSSDVASSAKESAFRFSRAMSVHRQAAGMVMLYNSPSLAYRRPGAYDTGDGTENG